MSAYGVVSKPCGSDAPLPSTVWVGKPNPKRPELNATPKHLTVHHLTLATALSLPGLIDHLRGIFSLDIEAGRTYPQETITGEGVFEAYFFGADVFIGLAGDGEASIKDDTKETNVTIEDVRQGKNWEDCVAGFYYVCHISLSDSYYLLVF